MKNARQLRAIGAVLLMVLTLWALETRLRGQIRSPFNGVIQHWPEEVLDKYNTHTTPPATIGKLFMQYGPVNEMYERALATHMPHNAQHNYRMSILRRQTARALWSKPAYMLQHLLTELEKPDSERLQWLFWFDSDIVLLNPHVPLELFLPPSPSANGTQQPKWDHIHAIVCQDHHGLNSGVFALRVDRWSAMLMANTLTTRETMPHIKLKYNDQSAMEYWLQSDAFRHRTMHVPQRWFNAYAGLRGEGFAAGNKASKADANGTDTTLLVSDPNQPQAKFQAHAVQEGDLAVHFAGDGDHRAPRMLPWLDVAEQRQARWEVPLGETKLEGEVRAWWEKEARKEEARVDGYREKCAGLWGWPYPEKEKVKEEVKKG